MMSVNSLITKSSIHTLRDSSNLLCFSIICQWIEGYMITHPLLPSVDLFFVLSAYHVPFVAQVNIRGPLSPLQLLVMS